MQRDEPPPRQWGQGCSVPFDTLASGTVSSPFVLTLREVPLTERESPMADWSYGANDAEAVKLYSHKLFKQAIPATAAAKLCLNALNP